MRDLRGTWLKGVSILTAQAACKALECAALTQLFPATRLSQLTSVIKPAQTTQSQRVLSQVCARCVLS